jgi:hypothetical protein
MTIAAGFSVTDGILLCADTEQSGIGVNVQESKLFRLPSNGEFSGVFAISGNVELAA